MTHESVFEGKDLEEALHAAAAALHIPEADLHYEILEQGRRGVFGLGAKSVRIRIMPPLEDPPPDHEEPPAERKEAAAPSEQAKQPARGEGAKPPKPRKQPRDKRRRKAPRDSKAPRRSKEGRPPRAPGPEPTEERLKLGAEIVGTLEKMVELMGFDLDVKPGPIDSGISLRVTGRDEKLLLEKNGELLWALQFVMNRMARRAWPDAGRIHLSGNGQTRERDEELIELVREVAQQVSRTGQTKKLQPMNAYERRLVHLTVREFSGLSSNSDGSGTLKRVRISKIQNQI